MAAKIDAGICERLMTVATAHCSAAPLPAPVIQTVREPNWEGVTTGLTALGSAISWGILVVALVALIGTIGFAIFVRQWAKDEARKAAEEWFEKEGRNILRGYENLLDRNEGDLGPQAPQGDADIVDVV